MATVVAGTTTGGVRVVNGGVTSNAVTFTLPNPQITSITPASGVVGTQITITGTGFGTTQGTASVNWTNATIQNWSDTQVVATVAAGTTSGGVRVVNSGVTSNAVTFTMPNPQITSISPTSGVVGTQITITGTGFGATQGTASVNWTNAAIQSWSDTQVVATVAAGTTTGGVHVVNGGVTSNAVAFTLPNPQITSITPASGVVGTQITITGTGFGTTQGTASVNWTNATIQSWSDTQVVATVAPGTTSGGVHVVNGGVTSNAVAFTLPNPQITSVSPTSGVVGTQITITGTGFGTTQGTASVNWTNATIQSWSDTQVVATVAPETITGGVRVVNGGVISNAVTFTMRNPQITSISPTSGPVGSQITITGTGFGVTQGTASVNWTNATVQSWSDTQIVATVAAGTTTGGVRVVNGGVTSNAVIFTIGSALPALNTSRYEHSATLLDNGTILFAGGVNCTSNGSCTYLSSAEIYDPSAGTITNTGSMATARSAPAVLLPNGRVLIAGGSSCDSNSNCSSLNNAEIYDPASGTFSSTGNMNVARDGHTLTLLSSGKVLVAAGETCTASRGGGGGAENLEKTLFGGHLIYASFSPISGSTSCSAQATAELYDPSTGIFSYTSSGLNTARYTAAAVRLADGRVLIVGGSDEFDPLSSAEIYDPTADSFTTVSTPLGTARSSPSAVLLNTGLVLIAGGSTCEQPSCPTNTAELFDPTATTFRYTSQNMNVARVGHTATLLTNGQIILAGGTVSCSQDGTCTSGQSTELYDPSSDTFTADQPLSNARSNQSATILSNGVVFYAGGIANGVTLSSNESYVPASLTPPGLVSISLTPAASSLMANNSQQLVATGTFSDGSTQALQSLVWTSSNPSVATISNAAGSAGIAYTNAVGTTTITASAGNIAGSATVNVVSLQSLSVSSPSQTLLIGSSQQMIATGTFSDGSTQDVTKVVSWSSSTDAVVISNGTGFQGLVFGANPGTVTVTATFGTVSGNAGLTVQAPAPPTSPSVASVSPTASVGGTQVTISGSGFGDAQGSGLVWLGSTYAQVVSWSDSQIVATVAANSVSGTAQIEQGGLWSNSVPFSVNTATIASISPISGVPGTQVTIDGSYFGTNQGSGNVWLGTANGIVQSWSDTEIIAVVASGATTGNAQVLQNGVLSNVVPFNVNLPTVENVNPSSGAPGTTVTILGSGFGSSQGNGTVWLGSTNGQITSWSDTQIVAVVAPEALTGIVKVEQNNAWSNAVSFNVPSSDASSVTLTPNTLNMIVGDTHTIQASNASGQSVTGLSWTSTNTNVVTLSTDDPPILTAVGPGLATITAGNASTDVTVTSVALSNGTIIWSSPGDGSGVVSIVPAVPSSTGVADVFAFNADGMVSALKSDGTTAWTASRGMQTIPDFQGGLVVTSLPSSNFSGATSIAKLDGITGQPLPSFNVNPSTDSLSSVLVYTDGTIFALDTNTAGATSRISVIGVNPTNGSQKFSVALDQSSSTSDDFGNISSQQPAPIVLGSPIIAGDGNAYIAYEYSVASSVSNGTSTETIGYNPYVQRDTVENVTTTYNATSSSTTHLMLLRVASNGSSSKIDIQDWNQQSTTSASGTTLLNFIDVNIYQSQIATSGSIPNLQAQMITNADKGVVLSWEADLPGYCASSKEASCTSSVPNTSTFGFAKTAGGSLTLSSTNGTKAFWPVVEAQDGTYYGSDNDGNLVHANASGVPTSSVPNDYPQIATADGGVVGSSGTVYDSSGRVAGITLLTTQSWFGNTYRLGSVDQVVSPAINIAATFWAIFGANASGNSTAIQQQWFPPLLTCSNKALKLSCPQAGDLLWNANQDLANQLRNDNSCAVAAQNYVFSKFKDANGHQITASNFATYITHNPGFYDGTQSTLDYKYAKCGDPGIITRFNCNDYPGHTVKGDFADNVTTETALTVTPSYPFKSFWQPSFTASSQTSDDGFGTGVDPGTVDSSRYGINIYNESNLLHEGLHGMTGLYDEDIESTLGVSSPSVNISIYIKNNVLSQCSTFVQGGK